MWYETSNGADVRPADIDATSSRVYIYVRRNIVRVPASGEGDERVEAHYRWEEMKIPRDMWEVCRKAFAHDDALDDVYAALTELADMIVEG